MVVCFIAERTILSQGGPTFQRGRVQLFPEGVQMLISIKIHITCDLQGGSGPPIPPLYPHMISMRERGNGVGIQGG